MLETIFAALAGICALFFGVKSWFSGREADKAKAQRDAALVDAEQQKMAAEAKIIEAEKLKTLSRKKDAIAQTDSDGVSALLDDVFTKR